MAIARWTRHVVLVCAVLGTIGCDRVTKDIATTTMRGVPSQAYLGDVIRLGYAENTGGFLSLGADLPAGERTAIFTLGTGLTLFVYGVFAIRRRPVGWQAFAIALFLAGSASNWVDHFLRGYVVDFLNVGIGPVRTGIFNVADVAIMIGLAIVVLREGPSVQATPVERESR